MNGRLVRESEACISAFDRGFLYGDGLFETLRAYGGKPFLLDSHWQRLCASAAFLGIPVPEVDPEALVADVLRSNGLDEANVRITLSRGDLPSGPRPFAPQEATLLVQARPLRADLPRIADEGTEARRLPWPLRARGLPLQGHKTLAYLSSVLALGAVPEGVEPLLETTERHLSETATANVFWVSGGRLCTPSLDSGCLPGVTRAAVLRLAEFLGVPAEEGSFTAAALAGAEEAFLTNSVVEVVPLVRLDGRPIGSGTPGRLTRTFQGEYRRLVTEAAGTPG